jgi:hypothetical protein
MVIQFLPYFMSYGKNSYGVMSVNLFLYPYFRRSSDMEATAEIS